MQIKFTNDDKLGLNKKWIRTIVLILGLVLFSIGLTHIFLIIIKPKDYEKTVGILGDNYVKQVCSGLLFIITYFVLKKSKPVNPN